MHKYDGTNWSVWHRDMTEVLSHVGVLDLVVNKSPRPEPASEDNADELLEWYRKDRLALRAIRLNISTTVYLLSIQRNRVGTVEQVEGFPNY